MPSTGTDLDGLLTRLAAGDPVAWSAVVERHRRLLRHVCRNHRLTAEQVDDVLQATWTKLFLHAGQIRDESALSGWLVTTAARECLVVRRRLGREVLTGDPEQNAPEIPVVEPDVDERLDARARATRLRRAVAQLPPRERDLVLALLDPAEPSYAEIGRRLQMPVGAIGPVRGRALRRLRTLLDPADAVAVPA